MKKGLIGTFLLLAIAFLAITYFKYSPGKSQSNSEDTSSEDPQKTEVIDFWNAYHTATDLRTSGEYGQAIELYQAALKINPEHQNALYYLGNMQLALVNYNQAEKAWTKLAELNPASVRAHSQLGTLYSCPDKGNNLYSLDKAEMQFAKALKLNREETGALLQLAKINLVNNKTETADKQLRDVVASNFRSAEAIFLLGFLAWKAGNIELAKAQLKESYAIVAGITEKKNVGEGETKEKSSTLEGETFECDIHSTSFKRLIDKADESLPPVQIYSQFNDAVSSAYR